MGADLASGNNPGNGPGDNTGDDLGNHRRGSGTAPGNHRNSGDVDDFGVPAPRPAPDDDITGLPASPRQTSRQNPWENKEKPQGEPRRESQESGSDDPVWWYDQPRKRGEDRRYWGEVEWIDGPEADQLRDKLTEIVRDLLDWAHTEQQRPETTSEPEPDSDSGGDGDTDDNRT